MHPLLDGQSISTKECPVYSHAMYLIVIYLSNLSDGWAKFVLETFF